MNTNNSTTTQSNFSFNPWKLLIINKIEVLVKQNKNVTRQLLKGQTN